MEVPESRANLYILLLNSTLPIDVYCPSVKEERAAAIATPGAAISGFISPSNLGPLLENEAIPPPIGFPPGLVHPVAYAATLTTSSAQEGSLIPFSLSPPIDPV